MSLAGGVDISNNITTRHQAKAMSAFLSGEMKDTVELNPAGAYGRF